MTDRDDFLTWVETALHQAELALHNGEMPPHAERSGPATSL